MESDRFEGTITISRSYKVFDQRIIEEIRKRILTEKTAIIADSYICWEGFECYIELNPQTIQWVTTYIGEA